MRHIKLGESTVMQEFERIAAEKGWITENTKTAEEHVPLGLVKEPHMTQHWQYPTSSELGKTPSPAAMPAGTLEPTSYQGSVIQQVQKTLEEAGEDLGPKGPDGIWGWFTSRAWNAFAKKYPQAGLPQTTEHQPPANALMRKMLGATPAPTAGKTQMPSDRPPLHLIKEPHMTQPHQYPTIKELVPKASIAIVDEFIALANDLDAMGETKTANAVDRELVLYKEAVDKLYDITGETGEQLIGEAHPGGGPTMAPAKEEGGKVETIVEEQKKDLKVVQKQPTGKQAAFVAKRLVALANRLDAEGKMEAALLVDKTLAELREGPQRPFVVNAEDMGVGGALDQIVNFLGDFAGEDPPTYYKIKDYINTLTGYKNKLWNTKNNKNARLRLVFSLENDYAPIGNALIKEMPWGRHTRTMEMWNTILWRALATERQQNSTLFQQWDEQPSGASSTLSAPTKFTTPSPQAAKLKKKDGPASNTEYEATYKNFVGTVDKLIKALTNPIKQGEIQKLFGGEAKLDTMLRGLDKLKREVTKPTSDVEQWRLQQRNSKLWNYYMKALKERKLAAANQWAKVAEDKTPENLPAIGQPPPSAGPAKTKPGARRLVEKRNDIGQLQQMLVALDMGPVSKSGKIDSTWGKYTATAWQKLNTRVKGKLGTFGPQNAPPPEAVRKAIQIANVIQRFSQGIDIAQGITLPVSAFTSVQAFMRALATRRAAGIDTSGNVDTAVNRKRALELLRGFSGRMEDEDIYVNLVTKLGEQGAQRFSQQVDSLLDALSAADAGIPGSYRMPGGGASGQPGQPGQPGYSERQPYSRSGEGGEGMGGMGTLESRPGGRGGAGAGSYSSTRRTRMSLEDRVYNIPDVSGFVNDPAQFTAWAQRYLKFARKPVPREPYAAAYAALELLRGQVADLQIETMTAAVNNREDLQDTLRQRHEAVNDVYNVLPKGR